MEPLPNLPDDGLVTPTVGDWAEEKYQLIRCYADIFSTSMKDKWEHRVYLDLFSGPGRVHIRESRRIIPATPLLVTDLRFPFSRYVFCETDHEKLSALQQRLSRTAREIDGAFVEGDTNDNATQIVELIPKPSRSANVLTFCLVDPYRLADMRFETIKRIAEERFVDFLVLIPSGMDASRNQEIYLSAQSRALDAFLGRGDWRGNWSKKPNERFSDFVVNEFGLSMRQLGYKYDGLKQAHLMTSTAKHLPLYHLVMFSRSNVGIDFWEKCKASARLQKVLF